MRVTEVFCIVFVAGAVIEPTKGQLELVRGHPGHVKMLELVEVATGQEPGEF